MDDTQCGGNSVTERPLSVTKASLLNHTHTIECKQYINDSHSHCPTYGALNSDQPPSLRNRTRNRYAAPDRKSFTVHLLLLMVLETNTHTAESDSLVTLSSAPLLPTRSCNSKR